MLYWASIFFIIALIAATFGFSGVAATSAGIAQLLFYIFLSVFFITVILHFVSAVKKKRED